MLQDGAKSEPSVPPVTSSVLGPLPDGLVLDEIAPLSQTPWHLGTPCNILGEKQLKITHFVDNIITTNMMEPSKMLLIFIP